MVGVAGPGLAASTQLVTVVPGDPRPRSNRYNIPPGELAFVVIRLERAGMPRLVTAGLLGTLLVLLAMCYFLCKRTGGKPRARRSHAGFQKVKTTDQFTDSEEEEVEFDK